MTSAFDLCSDPLVQEHRLVPCNGIDGPGGRHCDQLAQIHPYRREKIGTYLRLKDFEQKWQLKGFCAPSTKLLA